MLLSLVRLFGVSFLGSLQSGANVRIKYGIDPTAASLHLGHLYCFFVIKFLLRYFKSCTFYFVIGDYTARLRGFNSSYISTNVTTIIKTTKQFFRCSNIDFCIVKNSNWLAYLSTQFIYNWCVRSLLVRRAIVNLSDFTVGVLLYPFYQSYDNFIVVPHIEVGGSDQLFNFCFHSNLLRFPKLLFIMVPLVLGLGGGIKMSKSFFNTIAISGCAFKLFNFLVRLPEVSCAYYFCLFRSFLILNSRLTKVFIVSNCLYRLGLFILISRFFYSSIAFGLLSCYFSRVYFKGSFCNLSLYRSVYLCFIMVTYCFFKSARAFKKAVSNHNICVNGIRICSPQLLLLIGGCYEIMIGKSVRIYICT
ncbi:hypothetical protein ACWNX2_00085 [Candidatus Vidania fulgoroideorum]